MSGIVNWVRPIAGSMQSPRWHLHYLLHTNFLNTKTDKQKLQCILTNLDINLELLWIAPPKFGKFW